MTNKLLWKPLPNELSVLGGGECHSLKPDGSKKWSIELLKDVPKNRRRLMNIIGSPAISTEGTIYFVLQSDIPKYQFLYAVEPDGEVKWKMNINYINKQSSPKIGRDGTIYVNGRIFLHAIDPDGTEEWKIRFNRSIQGVPAIGESGKIFVGSDNNENNNNSQIIAVNDDGSIEWNYTIPRKFTISPAIGEDGILYTSSYDSFHPYIQDVRNAKVTAIYKNGTQKWNYTLDSVYSSYPSLGEDGSIYLSSEHLYALNSDGTLKWKKGIPGDFITTPTISKEGTIYVANETTLFTINQEGEEKWKIKIGSKLLIDSILIIGGEDRLYICTLGGEGENKGAENRLYAIGKKEDNGLPGFSTMIFIFGILFVSSLIMTYRRINGK